jgi:hypothetical protein
MNSSAHDCYRWTTLQSNSHDQKETMMSRKTKNSSTLHEPHLSVLTKSGRTTTTTVSTVSMSRVYCNPHIVWKSKPQDWFDKTTYSMNDNTNICSVDWRLLYHYYNISWVNFFLQRVQKLKKKQERIHWARLISSLF